MSDGIFNLAVIVRAVDQLTGPVRRMAGSLEGLDRMAERGRSMADWGTRMSVAGALTLGAANQMSRALRGPVEAAANFEEAMSLVRAVTNDISGAEFDALSAQARALGSTTAFSATQAAEGMAFLARAGFDANEQMAAMPSMLDLARAGQVELGMAADIASNILSGFGMEAEEMTRVADTMVATFTSANTDIPMLGETMKYIAPVARAAGMSLEEAAAMAGLLGNAGIQASQAGTTMRAMLQRLADPGGAASGMLDALGISVADSEGNLRNMVTLIGEVGAAIEHLGTAERLQIIGTVFGQSAAAGAAEMLDQGMSIQQYVDEITAGGGRAAEVAREMGDNYRGMQMEFASAMEGLNISLGMLMLPVMSELAGHITTVVQAINAWVERNPGLARVALSMAMIAAGALMVVAPILTIIGGFATMAGTGLVAIAKIGGAFVWLAPKIRSARGALLMLGGRMSVIAARAIPAFLSGMLALGGAIAGGVVAGLRMAATAIRALSAAMMVNPVVLIAMAIAGAAYLIWRHWGPISAFFIDLWADVQTAFEGFSSWVTSWWSRVTGWLAQGLDWARMIPSLSWADFVGLLTWENFLSVLNWLSWLIPLRWLDFIPGFSWAEVIGAELDWADWITSLSWSDFVALLTWDNALQVLDWLSWVSPLRWLDLIPGFSWSAVIGGVLDWGQWIASLSWSEFVTLFTWDNALQVLSWASWVLPIRWLDFIPGFSWAAIIESALDWGAWVGVLDWSAYVPSFSWAGVLTALDWLSWVSPLRWLDLIPGFSWSAVIGGVLDWGQWIASLSWSEFVAGLDWSAAVSVLSWASWVSPIIWGAWIAVLDWSAYVPSFSWAGVLTALDWLSWVSPLRWLDLIPGFSWSAVIGGVLDWGQWIASLSWSEFVAGLDWSAAVSVLSWASWVSPIIWGAWIAGLDWSAFVPPFSWSDVLVAISWGALIGIDSLRAAWQSVRDFFGGIEWSSMLPEFSWGDIIPDLRPALDAILGPGADAPLLDQLSFVRAGDGFFYGWSEGVELVDQYRQGLIGLDALHEQVSDAAGGWTSTGTIAQRLQDIIEASDEFQAMTGPQIVDPATLAEAEAAASRLAEILPEIDAVAAQTRAAVGAELTGVQAAVSDAVQSVASMLGAVSLRDHGIAFMRTLAEGIRAGSVQAVEAVRDTVQQMRDHLPHSPAKVGPLSDLDRVRFVETLAGAIRPEPAIAAVRAVAGGMAAALAGAMTLQPVALQAGTIMDAQVGMPQVAAQAAALPRVGLGEGATPAAAPPAAPGAAGGDTFRVDVNFAPVINQSGGAEAGGQSRDDLIRQLREVSHELAQMLEDHLARATRRNY